MDVAVATCRELPEPDPDQPYYLDALVRAGLDAQVLAWDDPAAPFDQARLVVIRSTWNYINQLPDYLAWVDRMGTRLHNPPAVVRWNSHKRYLVEAAEAGVPTVPTLLVERGATPPGADALSEQGWDVIVAKPAVSAGSYQTRRLEMRSLTEEQADWLTALCAERDVLIQPFVASVDGYGERSLITFDGQVSHAIRKSPRFADGNENVSREAVDVADDERELARQALDFAVARTGVPGPLAYARVDMARDAFGAPMVMELELIEPSLFFRQRPAAADVWAAALKARL